MTRKYLFDLLERTTRTFLQGFLAVVTLDAFSNLDPTWAEKVYVGLLAGAYAVMSAFVAKGFGNNESASVIDNK